MFAHNLTFKYFLQSTWLLQADETVFLTLLFSGDLNFVIKMRKHLVERHTIKGDHETSM